MKPKFVFIIGFLLMHFQLMSQIVNVETLRKKSDSAKWTGSISLDASLIKNTNQLFRLNNKAHLQYNNKIHLWLILNNISFQKVEGSDLVNKGTQHFRYNYRLTETVKMEAFLQAQYDAVSEIDFRGLAGLGPRFKLFANDSYRFYLGTLVMYEYEKASEIIDDRVQEDVRGSAYFTFSLYPTESLTVISTSYYQPKISEFGDYRVSTETSLLLKIWKTLAFKTTLSYNYDAFPILGIPKTQYELTNGLLYSF